MGWPSRTPNCDHLTLVTDPACRRAASVTNADCKVNDRLFYVLSRREYSGFFYLIIVKFRVKLSMQSIGAFSLRQPTRKASMNNFPNMTEYKYNILLKFMNSEIENQIFLNRGNISHGELLSAYLEADPQFMETVKRFGFDK